MFQQLALAVILSCSFALIEGAQLDVYYESLCPDSRRFIVNQLEPVWQEMGPHVQLRLIPFGKASFVERPDGGYNFTCQHGPQECSGNILHACGIKYSRDIMQAVTYASCLMLNPDSGEMCAGKAGIDYAPVGACWNDIEGEVLVKNHGVETLGLQPTLTFVPWLIFNKQWESNSQWDALKNLRAVLCGNANDGTITPCFPK